MLFMTKKIQKLNLSPCFQFLQHFVIMCLAVPSGNQMGVPGGPLGYQLSCGCNCTTPIFTNFQVYSRLQKGPVYKRPPFGSSLLSLKWMVALFSVYPKIEFASGS